MEFIKKNDENVKNNLGQKRITNLNRNFNFSGSSFNFKNASTISPKNSNFQKSPNFNSSNFPLSAKNTSLNSPNKPREEDSSQNNLFQSENKNENENKNKNDFSKNEKALVFLKKVIMISIFFVIAGLPLFFLNLTYQGINFEKQYYFYFWTFIGITAWATKSVLSGSFVFKKTPLDKLLLVFLIIYFLSTLFSVDRYHSFFGLFFHPINGLVSILFLILAYYLIIANVSYLMVKKLVFFISGAGSLISIWVSFNFISILFEKTPINIFLKIPFNLLGFSLSSLATYLVFLIPLILASLYLIDNSTRSKFFKNLTSFVFYFTLLSILFNILILNSFVYWVSFLIAFGILVIFILGKVIIVSPKIFYLSLFIFLLAVAFFVLKIPVLNNNLLQKELTMNYTLSWEITQSSVKNKPFLGSGPGTYGYNFSLFRPKSQSIKGWENERFYLGKGLFFENLATMGILGTISALTIILLYIGSFFHMLNRFSNKNKFLSLCFFASNLIIIFSSMSGVLDGGLLILGVLTIALSLIIIKEEIGVETESKTFSLKTSPQNSLLYSFLFLLVVVGIIFGLVNFSKMFLADINIKKASVLQLEKNDVKISEYFSKAIEKNKNEGNYYNILSIYCFDFLNNSSNYEQNPSSICLNNLTQFSLLSAKLMPNDVRINQMAGFIVYKSGYNYVADSLDEARKLYQKSLELEPKNPFFEIILGEINLTEAQINETTEENVDSKKQLTEEAIKLFEIAKGKFISENQYVPIYEKISIANENLGNIDEAIRNLEIAIEKNGKILAANNDKNFINQQMNYGFNLSRLLLIRAIDKNNQNSRKDFDEAENLLEQILQINDKEVNTLLSLGLLYEKTNRIDDAINQYNKILEILPAENESRKQVQKLIDNLNSTKVESTQ